MFGAGLTSCPPTVRELCTAGPSGGAKKVPSWQVRVQSLFPGWPAARGAASAVVGEVPAPCARFRPGAGFSPAPQSCVGAPHPGLTGGPGKGSKQADHHHP